MKTSLFIFLIGILLGAYAYEYPTSCSCPSWDGSFVGNSNIPAKLTEFKTSPDPEVINNIDYGKLMFFDGKVWLGKDVKAYANTYLPIKSECPVGYRIPSGDELRSFVSAVNSKYPTDPKGFLINSFGMNEINWYISTEKTYPNNSDGSTNEAWMYTSLFFKDKTTPTIETPSVYWVSDNLKARCVMDTPTTSDPKYDWIGNFTKAVYTNTKYALTYVRNNVAANAWRINNADIQNSKKYNWTPNRAGCHVIELFLVMFGGPVVRQCKIYWAEIETGSNADTRLNLNKIKMVNFTDFKINRVNSMHFSHSTAPIAPRTEGGSYVLFATKDNFDLYVRYLDQKGKEERSPLALGRQGRPFDITATPWGFVCVLSDKTDGNFFFIEGYYHNGSKRFMREIMNNGPSPTSMRSQIRFDENPQGEQPFGWKMPYGPSVGRVTYIHGRIHLIFSHANNFGDSARNDHNGDTALTFNEDGQDERLISSWISSHSLFVNIVATETRVISASLGDAYPENIIVVSSEVDANKWVDHRGIRNRIDSIAQSNMVSGTIPGDGGGCSLGTLGALTYMGNEIIAMTYQRKPGSIGWSYSDKKEVGIIFFYSNLTKIRETYLVDGSKVNVVKSARYGANILVATSTIDRNSPRYTDPTKDIMNLMVVSPNGDILSQSTLVTPFSLSADDDFETLSDGSVVWGFVDAYDYLNYYRITVSTSTSFIDKKFRLKKRRVSRSN